MRQNSSFYGKKYKMISVPVYLYGNSDKCSGQKVSTNASNPSWVTKWPCLYFWLWLAYTVMITYLLCCTQNLKKKVDHYQWLSSLISHPRKKIRKSISPISHLNHRSISSNSKFSHLLSFSKNLGLSFHQLPNKIWVRVLVGPVHEKETG